MQDRLAVSHGLQRADAESLMPRRQHQEGAPLQQLGLALSGHVAQPAHLTTSSREQARELPFFASYACARNEQRHAHLASFVRREQQIQPFRPYLDPAHVENVLTATE